MLTSKKFMMLDEGFKCVFCGKQVKPLGYTARNHCSFCLTSKHVDYNPGDRACSCQGVMVPIGIEIIKGNQIKIIHQCQKCQQIKKNLSATDDNIDLIIELSVQQ